MRKLVWSGVIAAVAILSLGCGGDDGENEAAGAASPTVQTAAEAGPTETPVPDTQTAAPTRTPVVRQTTALHGISDALGQSAEATSGRMEGSIRMTGIEGLPPGVEFSMPFSGEFDNVAGVFAFRMDLSNIAEAVGEELPPGFDDLFGEMEIRTIGDVAYMKFPFFSAFFGVETEWIKLPATEASSAAGGFSGGVSPANPTGALDAFRDAEAEISDLGRESVRGVETMHYLVVIDMQKLLENATPEQRAELEAQGPLPFDELPLQLWIGDDGLVYRYAMEFSGDSVQTAPGESFEMMTITIEIFDYGAAISVAEPPAGEVTDAEELGGLFDLFSE